MSIPGVSVGEATGIPPLPDAGVLSRVAMVAVSSAGTDEAKPIYALSDLAEFGLGVLSRHGKHLFAETKTPFLAVRCASTNPGTYDTIDNTAVTGTCVPAVVASIVPTDESELYIKIVDGCTIGTTGGTYRRSDSNGREGDESMPLRALGTGSRIMFADVNGAIDLEPPAAQVTALVTRTNDLRTKALAHMAFTTGTVHTSADTTSDDGIAAACTNTATSISLMGTIVTALGLHFVRGSGDSIHINAPGDVTTSLAASVAAVAVAVASGSAQDAILALAAITAAYAIHLANTTVHTIADATNTVSATVPTTGTLIAGDIIRVGTNAPTPADSDITAAVAKLVASQSTPAIVLFPGRIAASLGTTIKTGLNTLRDAGKPCVCFVQPRQVGVGESSTDYVNAVETEWVAVVTDNRICVVDGDYLCTFNDGAKLRQRLIGTATHFAVRAVNTEYFRTTWQCIQLDKVTIFDSDGATIGWDEAGTPDKPRKVQVFYRVPAGDRPLVPAIDYTLADLDNDRTTTVRERRVTDELHRIVRTWSFAQVGALAATTLIPNTATGRLNESVRLSFQQSLAAIIAANMGGAVPDVAISDTDKPDLVSINPIVAVNGAIVTLAVTTNYKIINAVGRITNIISVRTAS
jgi:hypothetical protein